MGKKKKLTFKVQDHESIDQCLSRIRKEGYKPVRRIEKPIFKEGEKGIEPAGREIIFEAVLAGPDISKT